LRSDQIGTIEAWYPLSYTYGLTAQNAKRKAVLIQLMALSDTSKYSAAVVEIEEKVNHCEEG
jgi:hypothetical protein